MTDSRVALSTLPNPTPVATDALDASEREESALLRLLIIMAGSKRLIVACAIAVAALTAGLSLLQPRTYTSYVSFTPNRSSANASRLLGLAAQFGVSVPGQDASSSPDFYARVTQTPQFEAQLATTVLTYRDETGREVKRNLMDAYAVDGADPGARLANAVKLLDSKLLTVETSAITGMVRVTVRTRSPSLSEALGRRVLELVNDFNLRNRQGTAEAERQFVNERLISSRAELQAAEDQLQEFVARNRSYTSDSRLQFEQKRLEREVDLRHQLFTSLAQSFNTARIDAMRNTPSINIIEEPLSAWKPDPRGIALRVVMALVFGGILGVFLALARTFWRQLREQAPESYAELRRAISRKSAPD